MKIRGLCVLLRTVGLALILLQTLNLSACAHSTTFGIADYPPERHTKVPERKNRRGSVKAMNRARPADVLLVGLTVPTAICALCNGCCC